MPVVFGTLTGSPRGNGLPVVLGYRRSGLLACFRIASSSRSTDDFSATIVEMTARCLVAASCLAAMDFAFALALSSSISCLVRLFRCAFRTTSPGCALALVPRVVTGIMGRNRATWGSGTRLERERENGNIFHLIEPYIQVHHWHADERECVCMYGRDGHWRVAMFNVRWLSKKRES